MLFHKVETGMYLTFYYYAKPVVVDAERRMLMFHYSEYVLVTMNDGKFVIEEYAIAPLL